MFRWIVRLVFLLVLLVGAGVALVSFIPADRIAGIAEDQFQAATGRTLSVEGDIRPTLWPTIGVKTGAVSIGDGSGEPMVTAEDLSVSVDWSGLMSGDVRVTGVELVRPVIRLAVDEIGQGNWTIETAPGGDGGSDGQATSSESGSTATSRCAYWMPSRYSPRST